MADNVKITIQESAENVVVRVTQQVDNVKITIGSGSGGGVVTELDPVFLASPAATITLLQISNWDDAYSWGDHSLAGYLTSETDPVFLASDAAGITLADITNWNTAYGWGDHAAVGYAIVSPGPGVNNRVAFFTSANEIDAAENLVRSGNLFYFTQDPTGVDITDAYVRLHNVGNVEVKNTSGLGEVTYTARGPSGYAHFGWYPGGGESGADTYELYSDADLEVQAANTLTLLGSNIRFGYGLSGTPPNVDGNVSDWNISASSVQYNSAFSISLNWNDYLQLNGVNVSQIETTTLGAQTDRLPVSGVIKTYVDSAVGGAGYVPTSRTITINGVTQDLSANRTWNVGDVLTTGSYANPSWITALAWSKITGAPAFITTETDPVFTASAASGISAGDITNWNTAFGWGNHAAAGYVTGSGTVNTIPLFSGASAISDSYFSYANTSTTQNTWTFSRAKFAVENSASNIFNLEGRYNNTNTNIQIVAGGSNSSFNFTGNNAPLFVSGSGFAFKRLLADATSTMFVKTQLVTGASTITTNTITRVALQAAADGYLGTRDFEVLGTLGSYFADDVEINGNLYLGATPGTRRLYVNGDSQFTDDLFLNTGAVIVQAAKKQTHTISGATFYSGGGDDGGAFTGDYSMWLGDEAAIGFTQIGAYPVNTGYGYGVFNGSKLANAAAFGAGAARGVVDMYAGGFTLTPTSAASAMTAMGAQSFRDVNWINNSTAVGFFAGSRFNNVFRSVFVGENAGSTDINTKVRNAKRVVAVGTSALYGTTGANNSHNDVISIGFESGLFSGLTKSILLGTYAGHRAAGTGGLVASNVIHIGHAESADLPISYGSNLSNVIVIGNDIVPVATNTIIFPTAYSMGVGTLNPQRKLHVEGDMRLTTLVSTPTKIIGVDAAGNIGEVAVGTNLTLTGGTLNAAGGGGGSTFLSLSDTPANYTGAGGFLLRVNAGATAVEFVDGTSLFAAASHTHAAGDITSGTFADARIALSNVTQHQASLSIGWGQLTGVPSTFAPSAHTLDSHSNVTITSNTSGELLMWNGSAWINRTLAEAGIDSITLNQKRAVVTFKAIEATTISTGEKTATRVVVPYSGTIVGWYIVTDVNTTATFDIWKVNAGIPAGGNTITASAKPAITAASYASSTTLTGWTTSVSQGDVMVLEVEANSAATEVGLFLLIEKN